MVLSPSAGSATAPTFAIFGIGGSHNAILRDDGIIDVSDSLREV